MPAYQVVFTPTAMAAINIMICPYEGQFEMVPYYRETENQGLSGNYAIKLGSRSEIISINIIAEYAVEETLTAAINVKGTFLLRETTFSNVRLLNVRRIRGLEVSTALTSGVIENTYTYLELRTEWIREAT